MSELGLFKSLVMFNLSYSVKSLHSFWVRAFHKISVICKFPDRRPFSVMRSVYFCRTIIHEASSIGFFDSIQMTLLLMLEHVVRKRS